MKISLAIPSDSRSGLVTVVFDQLVLQDQITDLEWVGVRRLIRWYNK